MLLLPPTCPGCGALGAVLCAACAAALTPPPALEVPAGLDACHVLLAYDGVGRDLVAGLKYRGNRGAVAGLGAAMAATAGADVVGAVVAWAPTSAARRRARGFDQAELLARAVGRALGTPTRCLLRRRPGGAQTGRRRAERRGGPAFVATRRVPPAVLLVDDVVTTGATLTAAAEALRAAGARRVVGLAAAGTPPPAARRVEAQAADRGCRR